MPCRLRLVAALLYACTGCALTPYEASFQCPLSSDFGHCTDVGGAYDAAVAGARSLPPPRDIKRAVHRSRRTPVPVGIPDIAPHARYAQLASAIDTPPSPLLTPPKVLRTLVVSYQDTDRTLFQPRYMFYLATESEFVLGNELNTPVDVAPSAPLFPTAPH